MTIIATTKENTVVIYMKQISISLVILGFFSGLFSTQCIAEDSETPKYTDEQLQKLKAAEEKYKDNPQVLKIINNIKANSGITDAKPEVESGPPPITAHGEVITQGSHNEAEEAFRNNDSETAIAHYKVLAAEGDPEASLKLGYIYEQQGDNKAAYAAYKKASESEFNNEDSIMAAERLKWLEKDVLSDEEIEQANQLTEEPMNTAGNQQGTSGTKSINNTNQVQYRSITTSPIPSVSSATKSAIIYQAIAPRVVKISPERISKLEHFKPEKFTRTPKS
jgi:tetratricopeptide (TPR) repeat protein